MLAFHEKVRLPTMYTKSTTLVELDQDDFAKTIKGTGLIPHLAGFGIDFDKVQVDEGGAANRSFIHDLIALVFTELNVQWQDKTKLYDAFPGRGWPVMQTLAGGGQLFDYLIDASGANQTFYPTLPIPLTFPMDEGIFLKPLDELYKFKLKVSTASAHSDLTVDNFDFYVEMDLIWSTERLHCPKRTWRLQQGAGEQCVLPHDGRHQLVYLVEPKAADAAKWDGGLKFIGWPNDWDVDDGAILQRAWYADHLFPEVLAAAVTYLEDPAGTLEDWMTPVMWPRKRLLKHADGLASKLTIRRGASADPVPDALFLTAF